ncbi:MAG TPA: GyrI-like domain-containing protein [Planctomycetota bacterium]|nr:GyrI-like domain-containing protein [Planctomycetota bacterium]HRR79587.1 GyrI-like domain-containing protein [Planctomycetota bacterium]HRT97216.1 GyrI-like domain-containing protein [Planctomycetota bacterium]
MPRSLLCALWAGLALAACLAAEEPKKPPEAKPEFVIGEMRIQTFPARTYLYAERETTIAKVGQTFAEVVPPLVKVAEAGQARITGPLVSVAVGATGEPDAPFKLFVGFLVADDTKPVGGFQVKKLAEFRCATVLYSGPSAKTSQAYGRLFEALTAAGHVPTGETREYNLYWESPESPNNVMLIQAGVKSPEAAGQF